MVGFEKKRRGTLDAHGYETEGNQDKHGDQAPSGRVMNFANQLQGR